MTRSPALAALCPKDAVTLVTLTRLFVTKTIFGASVSQCEELGNVAVPLYLSGTDEFRRL
jgi:hypothetical protein